MSDKPTKSDRTPRTGDKLGAGGAAASEQPDTPVSEVPVSDPPTPEASEPAIPVFGLHPEVTIIVCGTSEALPLLTKAWQQKAAPARIIPRNVEATAFGELMISMMADESIPDAFILVPANCFPTHRLCMADLTAYRIRRMPTRSSASATQDIARTGLPALLEAPTVLRVLEMLDAQDTYTEEEFLGRYNSLAHSDELPEVIGMNIGNTVAYAESPTPCPAKVAEALLRKKFICATAAGFLPIKEKLAMLYE